MAGDEGGGSLYDTLGVARNASSDEITSAYRRLSRTYHPDRRLDPHEKAAGERGAFFYYSRTLRPSLSPTLSHQSPCRCLLSQLRLTGSRSPTRTRR